MDRIGNQEGPTGLSEGDTDRVAQLKEFSRLAVVPVIARLVPESPRWLAARGRARDALAIVEQLEVRAGIRPGSSVEPIAGGASGSGEDEGGEGWLSFRDLGLLWNRPYLGRTLCLWGYAYAFGFFTFGFLSWLPTVLEEVGLAEGRIQLYTTIMDLFAVPTAALTAYGFFRWSAKGTLVIYPAIAGVAMLAFAFLVRTMELSVGSLLPVGGLAFGFGTILLGIFGPYCSEVYPTEVRGTGTGWATGVSRLGAVTAIPVGGVLLSAGAPLFVQPLIFGVPFLWPW